MTNTSKVRKFKHVFTPVNSAPTVSPEIQASLLQVGMRIRKSVGQGYRTHLAIEGARLRNERAGQVSKSQSGRFLESGITIMVDDDLVDQEAFCPSSQESLSSVSSGASASSTASLNYDQSRKRSLETDEEGRDDFYLDNQMEATSTCLRPIAQAKSRRQLRGGKQAFVDAASEHHQSSLDFEEADFLVGANRGPNPLSGFQED